VEELNGQVALVTGGSRGIGLAIARELASAGARLAVVARDGDRAQAAAAELPGEGHRGYACDVASSEACNALVKQVEADFGALDVLVNNAGTSRDGLFPLQDEEAFADVVGTNLLGTVRCCRAAVRQMWRRRAGVIVNVASVAAVMASPGLTSYAASKGGIVAFTRSLASELAPKGIRVNAVLPGLLDTGMVTRLDARVVAERRERIPLARLGTGDEVARAVLFLASPDAAYIVGQALLVDGGLSL
jgi:3-oxoacyl-[acyl-carrier protein] reductase